MRLESNRFMVAFTSALATLSFMTAMTPTPSPAPRASAAAVKEPTPVKNKKTEFSTRTDVHPCTGVANETCSIDTFAVAKALDNGELKWERRIYFRKYQASAGAPPPVIFVKSLKLSGKKLSVTNDRGDAFELEGEHGHMTSPKEPKEYRE